MSRRTLVRFALVAMAVATSATVLSAPVGAAAPGPDAAVSDRSPKVVVARKGPNGLKGSRGSGARPRTPERVAPIGAFNGPVLGDPLIPAPTLTESLITFDTRSQSIDTTYGPARMVVLITYNGNQWCTGFLIGPDTVATAGHCLHSGASSGAWYAADLLRIYPAYNAASTDPAPFGSCGAVSLHSTAAWTAIGDDQHDYGAVKLDCSVGNQTGWFGWWTQAKSLDGQITKIFGYPGDKGQEQWRSKDYVRYTEGRRIFYANDTIGGNSGSPVFRYRGSSETGCQGYCVLAVHAYGTYGAWPFGSYNHGARITQEASDNFMLWRSL